MLLSEIKEDIYYILEVLEVLPVCQLPLCSGLLTGGGWAIERGAGSYTEQFTFV